jgi:serpin B
MAVPASAAEGDHGKAELAAAQARLAFSLIEKIGAGQSRQATVSPASLASALDLVSYGADPKMKEAIARALGFGDNPAGLAAIDEARAKLAEGSGSFSFADLIVFAPTAATNRFTLQGLKDFKIPVETADLSSAPDAARIDAWVKDVTKGAIPEILGGPVSGKISFAALNALHFKGRWRTPFDPAQTAQTPFTGIDGKTADVAMMHLAKATRAFQQQKIGERTFVGVDLPFADERFSLVVVTTAEKPAAVKDFGKVAGWLGGDGFKLASGDLALPRFSASVSEDLLPTLDSLGLANARRSPTAFAGFGADVSLSRVAQRAMIDVDEEGAEAAAATAILGSRALEADDSVHMVVDKPFIYALRDKATGLILIAGYAGLPPKGKTA